LTCRNQFIWPGGRERHGRQENNSRGMQKKMAEKNATCCNQRTLSVGAKENDRTSALLPAEVV